MSKLTMHEFKALAPSMNLNTLSKAKNEMIETRLKEVANLQVRFNSIQKGFKETLELINDLQDGLLKEAEQILAIYRGIAK